MQPAHQVHTVRSCPVQQLLSFLSRLCTAMLQILLYIKGEMNKTEETFDLKLFFFIRRIQLNVKTLWLSLLSNRFIHTSCLTRANVAIWASFLPEDSCPPRLLKCSANVISGVLADMINSSILNGVYPSKLKMAKTVPVYKADDDTDVNNYRPISLLSHFNRIFEKMMKRRMESFIEQKNLLCPSQYGFRKAHSTQHAILDIVNAIQTDMDKQLFSCGVFIDLKNAFDTVDHNILLHKLDYYGSVSWSDKQVAFILLTRSNSNYSNRSTCIFKSRHYLWCASRHLCWSITLPPVH